MWGEKEGTYTNSERRVSKVNRAVAPPAEARPDFDIFLDLAGRLGMRDELFPGWQGPRDAFEEWKRVSAGRLCDYSAMTYEQIEAEGGMQWGGERLYADGEFPTADGRAKLFAIEWEPFPDQPGREYPFILNTGRTVEHWHTRHEDPRRGDSDRHVAARVAGDESARRAAPESKPHDRVERDFARSRVDGVELRVTEIIAPGQVFMPFHFVETNSNRVTQSAFDPISREPNFKQCAVKVEQSPGIVQASMTMEDLVVVGNGMAGVACLEQILKHSPKFHVTVFGDETHANYNRILLSCVLAGERSADDIMINPLAWYQQNHVALRLGVRIVDVDPKRRTIKGDDDSVTHYDKLLLATGSKAWIPPIEGVDKENVFTFRNLNDTRGLVHAAGKGVRAVVIGGGLLGLEAARGLQVQGCEVTVVHLMDTLMNMQLDMTGGAYLARKMEQMGVRVLTSRKTERLLGNGHVQGVAFAGGEEVPAELVVIAAGIRPNVELGQKAGLDRESRHRGQRLHGDERPAHLRGRRMRRA